MNPVKIRSLFESRSKQSNGRWRFLTEMKQGLGLCDANGNDHRDLAGNRILKERALRPESFSRRRRFHRSSGPSAPRR